MPSQTQLSQFTQFTFLYLYFMKQFVIFTSNTCTSHLKSIGYIIMFLIKPYLQTEGLKFIEMA